MRAYIVRSVMFIFSRSDMCLYFNIIIKLSANNTADYNDLKQIHLVKQKSPS